MATRIALGELNSNIDKTGISITKWYEMFQCNSISDII